MTHIKLRILDQSIVRQGSTVQDAIKETIATAKLAEDLGYTRFLSENHNSTFIAGSTPEVLMVKLADATNPMADNAETRIKSFELLSGVFSLRETVV